MSGRSPKYRPFRGLADKVKPAAERSTRVSFADSMGEVRPLASSRSRVAPPPSEMPSSVPAPEFAIERDDDWIDAWRELEPRPPRRAYASRPRATLDLHGLPEDEARRAVARFITARAKRGDGHVLIVVGKGRGSPGGQGLLRLAVVDWLTTPPCAFHVLSFRTASPTRGGTGAVSVRLMKR